MTDFRQTFDHVDVLKLEVGLPHPTYPNLIRNPHGKQGAWGWVTPVPNTFLDGLEPGVYSGVTFSEGTLRFTSPAGTLSTDSIYYYSESYPVTPGQYVGGRASGRTIDGVSTFNVQVEFLNSAGAVILTGAAVAPITTGVRVMTTTQAPAGAASVRMRVNLQRASNGARNHYFGYAMLIRAASSADVSTGTATFIEAVNSWVDVIGPTHSIDIKREGLNAGMLTARVLDATIDPAVATTIRPGRPVRLTTLSGSTWEPIFTGTLLDADVQYDPIRAAQGDNKHARITIAATDNITRLANVKERWGVELIDELRSVVEGASAGVPWNINGSTQQLPDVVTAVSDNENASVLDQVAITRDTNLGYAWVDRKGVLNVWDSATLSALTLPVVNGVLNPRLAVDTSNWGQNGGALTRSGDSSAPVGNTSGLYTSSTHAANSTAVYSNAWAVSPGDIVTGSAWIKLAITATTYRVSLHWYNGATGIGTTYSSLYTGLNGTTWSRLHVTGTAPATATHVRVGIVPTAALPSGSGFRWTGAMLTSGPDLLPYFDPSVHGAFGEDQYADLDVSFSTGDVINQVTVKNIEWDPTDNTKSVEVTYGPFTDASSILEWGPFSSEFTTQGLTSGQVSTLANSILAKNKTPAVRINSMTLPISTAQHITDRALIDLYNLVAVGYSAKKLVNTVRVTSVEHRIDETGWLVRLGFSKDTGVASPRSTPSVAAGGGASPWNVATLTNGWTNVAGWGSASYRRLNGVVYLRGLIAPGTTGVAAFTLPAGYRPGVTMMFQGNSNTTDLRAGRFDVQAGGAVVPQPGTTTWLSICCSFIAEA